MSGGLHTWIRMTMKPICWRSCSLLGRNGSDLWDACCTISLDCMAYWLRQKRHSRMMMKWISAKMAWTTRFYVLYFCGLVECYVWNHRSYAMLMHVLQVARSTTLRATWEEYFDVQTCFWDRRDVQTKYVRPVSVQWPKTPSDALFSIGWQPCPYSFVTLRLRYDNC